MLLCVDFVLAAKSTLRLFSANLAPETLELIFSLLHQSLKPFHLIITKSVRFKTVAPKQNH